MKRMMFALLLVSTMLLTGCSEDSKYVLMDATLDGHKVYYYETNNDVCISLYSTTINIAEEMDYEVLYNCDNHTVVLVDDEYIPLTTYISEHLESVDDLIDSGLGTVVYSASIMNILGIDINDFTVDTITVRTLNGEFKDNGGQWNESVELELSYQELSEGILQVMATEVEAGDVCDHSLCIILGNISPVTISLTNEEDQLKIHFYGNRYEIYYASSDSDIRIYNIEITSENEALQKVVMDAYESLE